MLSYERWKHKQKLEENCGGPEPECKSYSLSVNLLTFILFLFVGLLLSSDYLMIVWYTLCFDTMAPLLLFDCASQKFKHLNLILFLFPILLLLVQFIVLSALVF